jgi:hypothetical protein
MISAERRFPEIAQQLLAVRGSLDSLLVRLIELELGDCLPSEALREEVDDLLRTAIGRPTPGRRAARSPRIRWAAVAAAQYAITGLTETRGGFPLGRP